MSEYKYLLIPLMVLIISQILKCLIETIIKRKFDIIRLLDGSGGMPSTHSATVTSLTMVVALNNGVNSPMFAISLIFSLIVMYDAMGIRYETGKQAEAINDIVDKFKLQKEFVKLKETVGHKPVEVLCGMLLGVILGIIFNLLII